MCISRTYKNKNKPSPKYQKVRNNKNEAKINSLEIKMKNTDDQENRAGIWKDKIDNPLARLTKKKRGKMSKIKKTINEKGGITSHTSEIQRIIRSCYKDPEQKPSG